jgi:4-coumarate--CoA ligase
MDAGVVGRPDARSGEVPVAFVVKKKTALAATNPDAAAAVADVTADEVKRHVASHLAEYKQLADVVFVDVIPKSPSGKILRRLLKEKIVGGKA